MQVLEVAFYDDATGRRILDVEWEAEPESGQIVLLDSSDADGLLDARGRGEPDLTRLRDAPLAGVVEDD